MTCEEVNDRFDVQIASTLGGHCLHLRFSISFLLGQTLATFVRRPEKVGSCFEGSWLNLLCQHASHHQELVLVDCSGCG